MLYFTMKELKNLFVDFTLILWPLFSGEEVVVIVLQHLPQEEVLLLEHHHHLHAHKNWQLQAKETKINMINQNV